MRAMTALIKREFIEHRIAFLYAPAVLLAIFSIAVLFAIVSGRAEVDLPATDIPLGAEIYRIGVGGAFVLWSAYMLIGLFFYYADSFSADRRNNALLFWKSMPQSDLKILTSKALSGITVFWGLVVCFALLTAIFIYVVLLIVSVKYPVIVPPGLGVAAGSFVQMGFVGAIYLALVLLWYAPLFAWVAGLSTLFRRWSIPLAILIPGTVIVLEYLNSLRVGGGQPIGEYLSWRFQSFLDEADAAMVLLGQGDGAPQMLLSLIVARIDWIEMGLGLIIGTAIVYLASEVRRRRISA